MIKEVGKGLGKILDRGALAYLWERALGKHTEASVSINHPSSIDLYGHWALHQQAGLSAGTVADDDEFAADFSHSGCGRS